jgi:hypothetical protein
LAQSLGKEHPRYAEVLNQLATVYTQLGRNELAERCKAEAAKILSRSLTSGAAQAVARLEQQIGAPTTR